ncbi:DUF3304 domain-containing protein [Amantichitinum ursilacus]|uniref:DUF3304 domain-containing protein n=1 Tax=Amantichitinum ursilacus TaxID=857265 RepID=A0A0N0XLI7_9NEIS|nr:DUF3304 domain-containing protein [Amantichitinum ursilacus]KPC53777.1 hypothetical protein WG78_08035 [Amantichitinum ursilacus]
MSSRILNRLFWTAALGVMAMGLAACGNTAGNAFSDNQYLPTPYAPINHTTAALNWVSINGMQGTGEVCCVMLPRQWRPGLKATVEWEIDPRPYEKMKRKPGGGFVFDDADIARHRAAYTQHKAIIDIPQYPEHFCKLQVHFLTCNQVKATATCLWYDDPAYPIKAPADMPEPKTCPKTAE